MRITYKYGVRTISGKVGNVVHIAANRSRVAYGREYVKPKMVSQNYTYGEIKANIAAVWKECSQGFKDDMRVYTRKRIAFYCGDEVPAYSNYAHFIKLLYRFRERNPGVDLASVTKEGLIAEGCPGNVAGIIAEDYLSGVEGAAELLNEW